MQPDKASVAMVALALYERDGAAAHAWDWQGRAERTVADSADETSRRAVQITRLILMARDGDPAVWPLLDRLPRRDAAGAVLRHATSALYALAGVAIQLGHDRRARALLREVEGLVEHATHGRIECLPRVAELRLDWLAGRRTRLEEDYAALAHAHCDVKQINVDRALCRGRLAFAQGWRSLAHDHFATASAAADGTSEVDVSIRIAAALAAVRLAEGAPQAAWAIAEPALSMLRGLRSWSRTMDLVPVAAEAALACGHHPACLSRAEKFRNRRNTTVHALCTPAESGSGVEEKETLAEDPGACARADGQRSRCAGVADLSTTLDPPRTTGISVIPCAPATAACRPGLVSGSRLSVSP